MKKINICLILLLTTAFLSSCKHDKKWKPFNIMHSLEGEVDISIDKSFRTDTVIHTFTDTFQAVFAVNLTAKIKLADESSKFEAFLVDNNGKSYLIFESYMALDNDSVITVTDIAEETAYMKSVKPKEIRLVVRDAEVAIDKVKCFTVDKSLDDNNLTSEYIKSSHDSIKLEKIRSYIKSHGLKWTANHTSLSKMNYHYKKNAMNEIVFPGGLEYYAGGIFQLHPNLPPAEKSEMVEEWEWRNRHGIDWITPIRQQGSCGSCWIFSNVAVTEALVNLYFNDKIDLDLSEQNILSCTHIPWGGCKFGIPDTALHYLKVHGIVDESSFPYADIVTDCKKVTNAKELIKITDYKNFSTFQLQVVDKLKQTIIKYGPVGECVFYNKKLKDQVHVMTNVGWSTDVDKHTVWKLKSSWGKDWGDNGYLYTKLYFPFQTGFIYHQVGPIQSLIVKRTVKCTDKDGDGYYFWGLGNKPKNCPRSPAEPDGDDSNPKLGPLDKYGRCKAI